MKNPKTETMILNDPLCGSRLLGKHDWPFRIERRGEEHVLLANRWAVTISFGGGYVEPRVSPHNRDENEFDFQPGMKIVRKVETKKKYPNNPDSGFTVERVTYSIKHN